MHRRQRLSLAVVVAMTTATACALPLFQGSSQSRLVPGRQGLHNSSDAAGESLVFVAAPAPGAQDRDASFHNDIQPLLQAYCYQCHGNGAHKGDLTLDSFKTFADVQKEPDKWQLILDNLRKGEMPPPDAKAHPTTAQRQVITQWIESKVFQIDPTKIDPGRVTIHRLNRAEYNNTVRDLLGVDFHPADDFPPDDSGYGFDNVSDVLSMSPTLLEKYLKAAEKVARTALFGVEPMKPATVNHQPWYIAFDTDKHVKPDYDETGLSAPYSAHVIHRFPVEADYDFTGIMRGFRPIGADPSRLGFWIDGKMIHEGQIPVPDNGEMNGLHDTFRTHITAGDHWLAVSLLNTYEGLPPAYGGPKPNASTARVSKSPTENFVSNIDIGGPFNQVLGPSPESLKKIFTAGAIDGKHDPAQARTILTNLAHRAFRRPATKVEVDKLLALVDQVRKDGDTYEEGLCQAIQSILISPHFLFRLEPDTRPVAARGAPLADSGGRQLTPHELATRLSYFLWSSMPDDALLASADDGSLAKPDVLEAQTRRMLKDPKSIQFSENFGGQWLQFRGLDFHTVERAKFQQYTDYTIMSMREETRRFFDHIMRDDRSVLEFIDADYTFLNQRLADFYGIPGVKGPDFREVKLPADSHRGGVITQASVLTISSYATRTSPVIRGKWVLENLLNAPPPDPPPNVPALKDDAVGISVSLRQQLQAHRENPVCASCHSQMDPLGFGLENFDAIGSWRSKDGTFDIDASGELPDGRTFNGVQELKVMLMNQKQAFSECLADKMLTYALGRGLTQADHVTVTAVADDLAKDHYRFSAAVLGIVKSAPFQKRGAVSSTPARAP